jgi:ligand-binding sensor domain-containing protein
VGEFSVYRNPSSINESPADPDHLIISISGAGIYQYDAHTDALTLHRHNDKDPHSLPDNAVATIFRDRQGRHWVGMRSGLCFANDDFSKFEKPSRADLASLSRVNEILQDKEQNFWLTSSNNGIYYYNESSGQITHYKHNEADPNSLPDDRVFCLLLDHDGYLWIGTQNRGLCRLDPRTQQFIYFLHDKNNPNSLPDNGIYDLHEDEDHFLWIATENGLAKMDLKNFSMTNYSTKDGLCNNDIFSITPDEQGYFWLGTNNGMSRFDHKNMTFKNYFINDGLPTNRLTGTAYYSSNGILYFGTSDKSRIVNRI